MRILVLGGYGNFGARICRTLAREATVDLLVGGRNLQRAQSLAQELGTNATPVAIDAGRAGLAQALRSLGVELLIHTAGPFQQQSYAVARAAAAAGAHYIDLADGRRYVCDFAAALDTDFHAAGRLAVTGASTVPALSSAVVDFLARGWQRIDSIDICIAPAQTAPRGVATLAGVLSYCGEPIRVMNEGRWQLQRGWAHPRRVRFTRMRPRWGALCDIPDLELFPLRHPGVQRVMFRAALEVGAAQRALALLAVLRGMRLLPPLDRLARGLHAGARLFDRFGSGLGGMVVRVAGVDASGRPVRRAWHIAADNDHGPEIPCMAAIVLARRLAAGEVLSQRSGARTSVDLLTLADFEPEFARWQMFTDTVDESETVSGAQVSHGSPAL